MQYNVVSYLDKLKKSKFRSSFKLSPANPKNDGKQTPFKNHSVFIAQHATATCCRTCLNKWYRIPKGQILSIRQVDFCIDLIMTWITIQLDLLSSS